MDTLITRLFIHEWQKKCVAVLTALIIWFFVNHSITSNKTIPSVPIKVVNLPVDKTIQGLLPNGFLSKRTTLTVTGTKDVVEQLEPGDLEILLDIGNQPNEGAIQITKKNLVSLNPDINLAHHVTSVAHPEFVLKTSSILTEKIPVTINPPIGEAPKGYEYLDIWPMVLLHTVSGPQEQIIELKKRGLELTFDLKEITKEQLDAIQMSGYDDEVGFLVPDQWKKIVIPFLSQALEPLNDPEAKNLQINFLKESLIPIKEDIPIQIFYPLKYSSSVNPENYRLAPNDFIQFKNHIPILKFPLFAKYASKLFVDVVKDNLEIQIVAAPKFEREKLEWNIGFIDAPQLEDTYVAFLLSHLKTIGNGSQTKIQDREDHLRQRFRHYVQQFALYITSKRPLELDSSLQDQHIVVHIPNALPLSNKLKNFDHAN